MPRKTKSETTTVAKATIVKTKGTAATKKNQNTKSQEKAKPESIATTPKHSQIVLDYNRFGNIGFSKVHESVDISGLTKKKLTGRITALFHFLRNTSVTSNRDSGRTATFQMDCKSILSITQKAGDYDKQVFSLTKYKVDGTKQNTRRYSYSKTKNLILDAFGFEVKSSVDMDDEPEESEEIEGEEMLDIENDTELLPNTDFEYDVDNKFDDAE